MKIILTAWFEYELPECILSQSKDEILDKFKSLLDDCAEEYDIVFGGNLPDIVVDMEIDK